MKDRRPDGLEGAADFFRRFSVHGGFCLFADEVLATGGIPFHASRACGTQNLDQEDLGIEQEMGEFIELARLIEAALGPFLESDHDHRRRVEAPLGALDHPRLIRPFPALRPTVEEMGMSSGQGDNIRTKATANTVAFIWI